MLHRMLCTGKMTVKYLLARRNLFGEEKKITDKKPEMQCQLLRKGYASRIPVFSNRLSTRKKQRIPAAYKHVNT